MGRSSNFLCRTCKVSYSLGYGCYSTWLDNDANSVEEYDVLDSPHKEMDKNQNFRTCLEEHQDHDWTLWSEDWCSHNRKTDCLEGGGFYTMPIEVLAEKFSEYRCVVFEGSVKREETNDTN